MRLEQDTKLDFNDVMLRPMTSSLNSRADVDLTRTFNFKHSPKTWTGVPIIAANMDTIGTIAMAKVLQQYQMLTALHKFYTIEQIAEQISLGHLNPYYLAFTTGIREKDFERLERFQQRVNGTTWSGVTLSKEINIIMLDVPNGYIQNFVESCIRIRKMFPEHIIMAGNVVTPDITETLIQYAGVDVVKVGIGPGTVCTTRALTGVGYPQISAVMETSNAAHGLAGHIISDGGCRTPGDVAKALCAGADFVMLGGLLSGHDECAGEIVEDSAGNKFMKFYGMSSSEAMNKHYGGVASHRAPEGKTILKEYKGPVQNTVLEILGGVRSCATYIGAAKVKEMHKRATFVKVNK